LKPKTFPFGSYLRRTLVATWTRYSEISIVVAIIDWQRLRAVQ